MDSLSNYGAPFGHVIGHLRVTTKKMAENLDLVQDPLKLADKAGTGPPKNDGRMESGHIKVIPDKDPLKLKFVRQDPEVPPRDVDPQGASARSDFEYNTVLLLKEMQGEIKELKKQREMAAPQHQQFNQSFMHDSQQTPQ